MCVMYLLSVRFRRIQACGIEQSPVHTHAYGSRRAVICLSPLLEERHYLMCTEHKRVEVTVSSVHVVISA